MPRWSNISGGWKVNGWPKTRRAALAGLAAIVPALLVWRFLPMTRSRPEPEAAKQAVAVGRFLKPAAKALGFTAARSLLRKVG